MKFADLHLHTIFSDGTYTPGELIGEVKKREISAISVVDHDTVEGIAPTLKEAESAGIEVLPGIELSANYHELEVHILGYLIDFQDAGLLKDLNLLKEGRIERIYKIIKKLEGQGINLEAQEVFSIAQKGIVGRLHVAKALLAKGCVASIHEAFYKYLGDGRPAYVCDFKLSPQEAIKLIKGVGGIPVLAHPYTLKNDNLINLFVDGGLEGLEVFYPEHSAAMTEHYRDLAKKFGLIMTGGSDCHGILKSEGNAVGSVKVPYEVVEELKQIKAGR